VQTHICRLRIRPDWLQTGSKARTKAEDADATLAVPRHRLQLFRGTDSGNIVLATGESGVPPWWVARQGGFTPNVFLLSDYGFSGYTTTIETRPEIVEKKPDLVQRFVDASAIGWYHYLYGDNVKANEMIKNENREITDAQIAFSIAKLKEYGIVDSGDTFKLGIGAMTDERVKDFFDKMVKAGLVRPDTNYKRAYTLKFVNKGVGLELRPH
jgi:NitT/TauT family transport system substrate-binding protein